ncbi:PGA2 domain containing protein [Pyrenophora tritici-repentis]|nr:PGA2 domain containing protein [Pyrenophora tritici-repentis]
MDYVIENVVEWKNRFVNNGIKSLEEMTAQRWVRIIAIIGAYLLIRPYLLNAAAKKQKQQLEREAEELGLGKSDGPNANDFRGKGVKVTKGEVERFGVDEMVLIVSRFNKVGNREMYMNCAVVNIVPRGTRTTSSKPSPSQHLTVRDTAKVNAVAQAALASYSDLFVANLAGINTCVAPETHDVVFGDPGRAVQFGDNVGAASKPTFQRNACTDKGHTSAGTSSDSASSPSPPSSSVSSTGGDDGQWHGGDSTQQQSSTASSSIVAANDGKYNPVMHASTTGQKTPSPSLALQQNNLQAVDVQQGNKQPNAQVQKELNAYLARLYGTKTPNKQRAACTMEADAKKDAAISAHTLPRTRRQKRWFSYQSINPEENDTQDTSSSTQATTESDTSTTTDENNSVAASSPQSIDASFAAFLQRLNSLSNSLFTLVKFTSSYLDQAPPGGYYDTSSTTTTTDANDSDRESSGAVFTTEKQYTKRSSPSIPSHGEMSDTPGPNNQALKHWLDELKAQVDAMKSYTQNTAARFDAKNVATLRQRRQSKPMGQQTEILFDWGSLYPGLKTNSSRIGAEAGGEERDLNTGMTLDLGIGDITVKTATDVLLNLTMSNEEMNPTADSVIDPNPDLETRATPNRCTIRIPQTHSMTTLNPQAGRVGASNSPTQRLPRGPDGTLFGSLPKYKTKAGLALGFGAHVLRTYRHIKAEHEAGHRTRSFVEKRMDEVRGRKRERGATNKDGGRRLERSRSEQRRPEKLKRPADREKERREVDKREMGDPRDRGTPIPEVRVQAPMNTERPRRKPVPVHVERSPSARSIGLGGGEGFDNSSPSARSDSLDGGEGFVEPPPREVSTSALSGNSDRGESPVGPPPREISPSTRPVSLDERQAPVEPARPDTPRELSPSVHSLELNRCQSPIEPLDPNTASLVETIDTSRAPSPIMSQAPSPPSPPPGNRPLPPPTHVSMVALLSDIKGGFKLRKVTNSKKKDTSENPSGERVVYDETPHSRDVEERERAQLAEGSTAGPAKTKADAPPDPNQAFQEDLMKALKRRSSRQVTEHECATELGRDSFDSSLTSDSRTSMMVNVSRHLHDQSTPVRQLSTSESGENLLFTLAAHIARPDWSFDGLEMTRQGMEDAEIGME